MRRPRALLAAALLAGRAAGGGSGLYEDVSYDPARMASPSEAMARWEAGGDAQPQGDCLRLTPDEPHKRGTVSARHAALDLGSAWTADVTLRIHGHAVSLSGDGLGVWYTSQPVRPGPLMGGPERYTGLGLFLDTYVNSPDAEAHVHPYLAAAVNDGSELAAHDSVGLHTSLHAPAGCSIGKARQPNPHESRAVTLRVSYSERTLRVDRKSVV